MLDAVREDFRVVLGDKKARTPVLHDMKQLADSRGDERLACGHRLDCRHAHATRENGQGDDAPSGVFDRGTLKEDGPETWDTPDLHG